MNLRNKLSRLARTLVRIVTAPFRVISTAAKRVGAWMADPDLDVVGMGVISTLVGRTFLFAMMAAGFIAVGMWYHALSMGVLIGFDVIIHLVVLRALLRLMRYDATAAMFSAMGMGKSATTMEAAVPA